MATAIYKITPKGESALWGRLTPPEVKVLTFLDGSPEGEDMLRIGNELGIPNIDNVLSALERVGYVKVIAYD